LNIGLVGNAILHILYYFPIEIYGFFNWKKNLKKHSSEIIKEKMATKKRLILGVLTCIMILILSFIFKTLKNPCPILDSTLTSLSIVGMFLCVKRYIEQWAIWTMVNIISIFMWFEVFIKGEGVFSIFIVRVIYLFLGIYFYIRWRKELKND
jgi:nicotinamide mononucleotide transporter